MPWDNAPWMIGGGVEHSVEVARLLAYIAGNGKEGIVRPTHLRVTQSTTPGANVRVATGAAVVLNRTAGADSQSYIGRMPTVDTAAITPTTAAARSDLIIGRVEDPYQPGNPWTVPSEANKQTTQYIKTIVIPNVSSTARTLADAGVNYSAVVLARVTLPANTSTVLDAHITDLRTMYMAQTEPGLSEIIQPGTANNLTNSAFVNWPSSLSRSVLIPTWATQAQVRVILGQIGWGATGNNGGNGWNVQGNFQVQIGTENGPSVAFSVDSDSGIDRGTLVAGAAALAIPANLRGTTQTVRLRGQRTSGNAPLIADTKSMLSLDLSWLELPGAA